MSKSTAEQERAIRDAALRELGELSLLLDSDPELIESMSLDEARAELLEIGVSPYTPLPEAFAQGSRDSVYTKPGTVETATIIEYPPADPIANRRGWLKTSVNALKRFLYTCSGANTSILLRPECATEQPKYLSIGVISLFISVMSALSVGYALSMVFSSPAVSHLLGAGFGASIFFLNRLNFGFAKDKRSLGSRLLAALPRAVVCVVLSIIVVEPLLLRLFDREITQRIEIGRMKASYGITDKVKRSLDEIDQLEKSNQALMGELDKKEARRDELFRSLMDEATGTGSSRRLVSGMPGKGPIYEMRRAELQRAEMELDDQRHINNALIQNNTERIKKLKETKDQESELIAASMEMDSAGLLGRLEAFRGLTAESSTLAAVNWAFVLAFLMVSGLPLLIVLISAPGPYEVTLERVEKQIMVREERELLNLEMQAYIDSEVTKELKKIMLGAKLSVDGDADIATTQAEFGEKLAFEVNRRLKERLESLSSIFSSEKSDAAAAQLMH